MWLDLCVLLAQTEQSGTVEGLSVIDVLMELRRSRMGLIQAPEQLRFSYQAILEGAKRVLHVHSDGELAHVSHVTLLMLCVLRTL